MCPPGVKILIKTIGMLPASSMGPCCSKSICLMPKQVETRNMKQQTLWTVATGAKQSRISQGTEPPLSSLPCIQTPNDHLESETGIHLMHTLPGAGIAHRHLSILFRASLVIYHEAWGRVKVVNRTTQIFDLGENEWETYREGQQLGRGRGRRERSLRMPATSRSSKVGTGQVGSCRHCGNTDRSTLLEP